MLKAAAPYRNHRRAGSLPLTRLAAACSILLVALALSAAPHLPSTPPDLDSAAAALSWNSGSGALSWYYTHPGDYNQDGLVTVSDITPLGQNFDAAGPFSMDSALSVIDGNSDGFITVSDITPIGQNFNKSLERYQAFHSSSADDYPASNTAENGGGATLLGTVQLINVPLLAGKRRHCMLQLGSPPAGGFGWVRPLSNEYDPGTPSPLISFGSAGGNAAPVAALSADPATGDVPLTVSFDASGSSDPDGQIVQYSWDFDGDAFTDLAGGSATAAHTFLGSGLYSSSVRVLDDQGGQDSASVQITVAGTGGQPPSAQLSVIPERAAPGMTVVLHGAGSSDPEGGDLRYSFDPEGDGSFHPPDTDMSLNWIYTRLGDFEPALRVFDDDGQFDTVQGSLEISLGEPEKYIIDQQAGQVPATGNIGMIIADGKPGIAYYDPTAELDLTLRWRGAKDAAGSEWWDQRALGTCDPWFSLGLAGGNPCIAYVKDHDVRFMRADDPDGAGDWGLDRPIIDAATHSEGGILASPSLADIGGRPTVFCVNGDSLFGGDLLYIRASNAKGTVWPVAARTIGFKENHVALICAPTEVSGHPAVAFVGGSPVSNQVFYKRCYDTEGISWTQTPAELTALDEYGLSNTSLQIVAGYPAMIYHGYDVGQIEHLRALDADGAQWGPSTVISEVTDNRGDLDLEVINGLPWIAYSDHAVGLFLAVAADVYGAAWNEPVLVDAGTDVGKSVRLVEIDGRAALAYYNLGRQNIEFVVYR